MIELCAGYNNLGWNLSSLTVDRTSVQALLAFQISIEKSDITLKVYLCMLLSLFPLKVLVFFLWSMCLVLWLLGCEGIVISGSYYLVFCMLHSPLYASSLNWNSSPSSVPLTHKFVLFTVSQISWMFSVNNILFKIFCEFGVLWEFYQWEWVGEVDGG